MKNTQIIAGIVFFFAALSVQASPILNIQQGILMGASGVIVEGQTYDVIFRKALKGENLGNAITFNNLSSAIAATTALSNDVFVGDYDLMPLKTNGCSYSQSCVIETLYAWHPFYNGALLAAGFTNSVSESSDGIYGEQIIWQMDVPEYNYAIWSKSTVPEPSTISLFCLACLVLASRRRKHLAS